MKPYTNGPPAAAGTHPPAPMLASNGAPDYVSRTWLVTTDLAGDVAQLADGLQVTHSAVVRELLRYALAEARAGRLDLQARPTRWALIENEVPA